MNLRSISGGVAQLLMYCGPWTCAGKATRPGHRRGWWHGLIRVLSCAGLGPRNPRTCTRAQPPRPPGQGH
eukprot:4546565-Alexandrium_andersonii.AAC.1